MNLKLHNLTYTTDPDGPVPRIVENPTAGFPLIPSFGVRVRF